MKYAFENMYPLKFYALLFNGTQYSSHFEAKFFLLLRNLAELLKLLER